jgi:multimeric flavodoxin WrbA
MEDDLQTIFKEMKKSQAIVLVSPLYFKIPSRLTAFMERLACLSYFYGIREFKDPHPLNDKPCGLVAVTGGDSPYPVLAHLHNFVLALRMKPITMKSYPYLGVGGKGKVEEDKDLNPIENAKILGELLVKAIDERVKSMRIG